MSPEPTVSVIITMFNVGKFVAAAVRSVLEQTFNDLELIVVDDGSTDDSVAQAASFEDARLRVVRREHCGPVGALNFGISQSCGRYMAYLDGDDAWKPDHLETQVRYLESHPEADMVFCQSRMIDEDGSDLGPTSRAAYRPLNYRDLLSDNLVGNGSAVLIRRSAYERMGPFDEDIPGCYDLDGWLRIARLREGNVHCIPRVTVLYRRRVGQITKNWRLMLQGWQKVINNSRAREPRITSEVERKATGNMMRFFAFTAYERRQYRDAAGLLARAFSSSPADLRNWFLALALCSCILLPRVLHERLERTMRGLVRR